MKLSDYKPSVIVYDNLLQINIKSLLGIGLKEEIELKNYLFNWSIGKSIIATINLSISTTNGLNKLRFSYRYNDEEIVDEVKLLIERSNLNKGIIWFMECPKTKAKCKKLYLHNGHFLSRKAFKGFYKSQLSNEQKNELIKMLHLDQEIGKLYEEMYSKHFKKTYQGKPTKRYSEILKRIEKLESSIVFN